MSCQPAMTCPKMKALHRLNQFTPLNVFFTIATVAAAHGNHLAQQTDGKNMISQRRQLTAMI